MQKSLPSCSTQWTTTVNNRFRAAHFVYNSSYHRRRDDGPARFTTVVWRQLEQEVVLICEHAFLELEHLRRGGGGVWGRIWMRQQYISAANFLIVFHSNCGTILLSFWDMTTGRTADDGRRTDDSNDRIIWPLRRTSNKRWVDTV